MKAILLILFGYDAEVEALKTTVALLDKAIQEAEKKAWMDLARSSVKK